MPYRHWDRLTETRVGEMPPGRRGRMDTIRKESEVSIMTWYWRFQDASGDVLKDDDGGPAGRGVEFATQSDAESWIGEHWRQLAESGVHAVTLYEDDHEVYGPMSLEPPD